MQRLTTFLVDLPFVVAGVVCIVLGNRTHRAIKIDGLAPASAARVTASASSEEMCTPE